jgi:D-alanyl-D-alanine carboxypeptidase (penicillin-binding protein 5/6)
MNRRPCTRFTFFAILICSSVSSTLADPAEQREPDRQLRNAIGPLVDAHQGDVAVAIEHLDSGDSFRHRSDQAMPTASLIKFPLLVAAYHAAEGGDVDLDMRIELKQQDKVPGSGLLTEHVSDGAVLTLRDYVRLMMRYSDNTATNIVAEQVGLRATAERMESLGCPDTKMNSLVYRRDTSIFSDRSKQFGLGSTTAAEMVRLLALLHRGQLAGDAATREMTEHLLACDDDTKMARFLSPNVKIAHKTGAIANCRTDAGILYTESGPVAVCVLTNKNEDQSWSADNAANLLCASIAKAVVNRFGGSSSSQSLQQGAVGKLVETLQRTLNKRLSPSPELAIDGDFGPASRGALERFQSEQALPITGVVDRKTWQRMGPLIEQDDPVPDPEIVRAEVLPITARPPLSDPPIVTCKAWVVGDTDGNVLWESNANAPLEPASTTKIMTAYVVLRQAEEDPGLLDESITFSERADRTVGSTSGIRSGESVTIRESLYGLLLPSGNDASVALAEHCGRRLEANSAEDSSYESFIEAMNATAAELGMANSNYQNTHGLSDPLHVVSAADLLRLGAAAMQIDLFRQIVRTRQFGCRVESDQGYARNVLWKNTNRLLAIEGYTGVKTGTTSAAGACLVSRGRFGKEELMVVVLGSSSSDARYADTRNLYRWAWEKRQSPGEQSQAEQSPDPNSENVSE